MCKWTWICIKTSDSLSDTNSVTISFSKNISKLDYCFKLTDMFWVTKRLLTNLHTNKLKGQAHQINSPPYDRWWRLTSWSLQFIGMETCHLSLLLPKWDVAGPMMRGMDLSLHNIIQIHNNVQWDWQYFTEYSLVFPYISLNVGNILWSIVSATEHCYGSE